MVVNDASSCGAVKFYLERADTLAAMPLASDYAHAHLPPDHPKMGNVLNSSYAVLLRYGRYAEAEPLIRRHLELERSLRSGDADEVYDPLSLLARALELRGEFADAEGVFRAAAEMADRLHLPFPVLSDAELRFAIDRFDLGTAVQPMRPLNARLRLHDGRLRLEELEAGRAPAAASARATGGALTRPPPLETT